MAQMMKKLNLLMMMDMKNTHIKKLLRVLLIIQKEDIQKLIVTGKERKYLNTKVKQIAKNVED